VVNPEATYKNPTVSFLGRYSNGKPVGNFWIRTIGYGSLHGRWQDGEATGDGIAFIYGDMNTAFYGKFEKFVMKSTHEAEVLETRCDKDGMIVVSKYSETSGPEFYYEPPTNVSFGAGPPGVVDPYERKSVKVAKSSIPDSGDGVFALVDFRMKQCTSLYSGYLYNGIEEIALYNEACINNLTLSMDERRQCKKYSHQSSIFELDIQIPPSVDKPEVFHPTLGPKVKLKEQIIHVKAIV